MLETEKAARFLRPHEKYRLGKDEIAERTGSAYVVVTGRVRHISIPERTLVMEDGTAIALDDIAALTDEE